MRALIWSRPRNTRETGAATPAVRPAVTLMRSKVVHAVALVVAVPVGLQDPANIISLLPKFIFWFGGQIEAVLNANNAAEACKGVVTATVKFWSGIFVVDLFVD